MPAAMVLPAEATTPAGMCWLPNGMEVRHLAKSTTNLVCTAQTTEADWAAVPDVPVHVEAIQLGLAKRPSIRRAR